MGSLYVLTTFFMLVIMAILLTRIFLTLKKGPKRKMAGLLVMTTALYILMDAMFAYCFVEEKISIAIFRIVVFLFYLIYVNLPLVWYLFSKSYIKNKYICIICKLIYIPYFILVGMVIFAIFNDSLWIISDTIRYDRGYLFQSFTTLNLFYYFLPLINIFRIVHYHEKETYPFLWEILLFTTIPLIGVLTNTYLLTLHDLYPFQPFCYVIGTLFAYFFIVEKEELDNEKKYRHELEDALAMAYEDTMTGFENRRAFEEEMKQEEINPSLDIAFISLDINNLKTVNDCFGHEEGDCLIKIVAQAIRHVFDKRSHFYRIGGDEFIIIVKDTSDEEVKRYIDQFHQYLDQYSKQSPYQISVAAGYALRKDLSITVQDMYMQADSQMYMNKYQMKNKSC